jgi:predicted O-linked N-acetylglucosamine transferase (SPINDLY family)
LALKPTHAQAHNNRGAVLRDVGRHEEALQAFATALSIKTDYAEALNNQGGAFQDMGRHAEAFAAYSRATEIQPAFAEAYNNRGSLLEELHRHEEALADYSRAIALAPGFARAHANRGNALSELHRHEDALESYRRALELEPESAGMLANRAAIFSHLKRHDQASADYEHLLQIAPSHPYALGNLLMSRLHCCDWSGYEEALNKLQAATLAAQPAALPFTLAVTSARADVQLEGARQYVARECTAQNDALWQGERYEHARIRLAYLSADLHDHATAHLMIDLFEQHDRSRFEVTAISFGPDAPSTMRERLKNAFDHFVEARHFGDEDVARLMHEREIDIAIDLKGHTRDSRPGILAHRPAPVQVNYLGFPGTMGAPFIDYIIADGTLVPDADLAFYSERVVRLSGSYQINSKRAVAEVQSPDRTSAGLPADGFVFCSFNNNYKITPDVFACWMRLLHEVPRGVLWLLEDNAIAARNLRQAAERSDIDGARLIFAPRAALPEHLARHRLADLFLDTTPCNAHTTASDALWAGLPLLTCRGTTFAGRVAQSLLQAIGLPELVADDLDGYYKKAIQLAGDPSELSRLRRHLQANRSAPPFDSERTRWQLESAYATMHQRAQGGLSPMPFDVAPDIC